MADPGKKLDRSVYLGDIGAGPLFAGTLRKQDKVVLPEGFDPERPEESYQLCVREDHRRRLGQFFTPKEVAKLMCSWVLTSNPSEILDPAVGPGIFVREVLKQTNESYITAIDVDPMALEAARTSIGKDSKVNFIQTDFLTWGDKKRFDAIVANPPYLKHHNFLYNGNIFSDIGLKSGVKVSRLTNIYVLFVLEICRRLKEYGRAAIIVPGEWVNANYGMALKEYLIGRGLMKILIYFSHYSLVFDKAITTASVIFIEKPKKPVPCETIITSYVKNSIDINLLKPLFEERLPRCKGVVSRRMYASQLLAEKKWDYVLKNGVNKIDEGFISLSKLAETRRGIATGANKYFHVTQAAIRNNRIRERNVLHCVGRALDVRSYIFKKSDFEELVASSKRVFLINFEGTLTESEQRYITDGERDGLPKRYLLAARNPWYKMEKRNPSPIWAAVFGRKGLRFILNDANVYNLTAFHCIYPKKTDRLFAKALVAVLNSRKVQELAKHEQRVYGGGLAKFEPRDLLDIKVPNLNYVSRITLESLAKEINRLDRAARNKKRVMEEEAYLDDLVDKAAKEAATLGEREH